MRTQCYSHAINTLTYDLDQGLYVQNSTLEGKERELSSASSAFRERIARDPCHVLASHDSLPTKLNQRICPFLTAMPLFTYSVIISPVPIIQTRDLIVGIFAVVLLI
jgi:hypothetical protein